MDSQKQDDEFDLRNYVRVIIKRRKLILRTFLGFILCAVIVSFLMPKTYKATALILVAPSKIQTSLDASNLSLDRSGKTKDTLSLQTHEMLIKSDVVAQRVIDKMHLTYRNGRPFSAYDLLKEISVTQKDMTSVIELSVKDSDPVLAMNLANVWAREYTQYSQELISGEIKGVSDFVVDQFAIARKNLENVEAKLSAFRDEYKTDLMLAELNMKKSKLNTYKTGLLDAQVNVKIQEELLKELKSQIAAQNQFIVTSKAITDDALWQQTVQKDRPEDIYKKKLQSESVNPIYQGLEKKIVDTETALGMNRFKVGYLQEEIDFMQKDIDGLEKIFNQKQLEYDQLVRELAIYKRTYDNLSLKIEEARIAKAAQLGEVRLVSPAEQPQHPESPKKLKNIMVAGIIGLMVGLFVVFFREWFSRNPA